MSKIKSNINYEKMKILLTNRSSKPINFGKWLFVITSIINLSLTEKNWKFGHKMKLRICNKHKEMFCNNRLITKTIEKLIFRQLNH